MNTKAGVLSLKKMKAHSLPLTFLCCTIFPNLAESADHMATIDARLTLTAGCLVNGIPVSEAESTKIGILDFGNKAAVLMPNEKIDAVIGNAENPLSIQCSQDVIPTVTVTNTKNAPLQNVVGTVGTTERYLNSQANATSIAYSLYADNGYSTVINNGTMLSPVGQPVNNKREYMLFGRIIGKSTAEVAKAGVYMDAININIAY